MQDGDSLLRAARLTAIEALDRASSGRADADALRAAGVALEREAAEIPGKGALIAYADFGLLLQKFSFLARWAAAVRNAELSPERFLLAAKQGVRDFERRGAPPATPAVLEAAREAVLTVSNIEEVEAAARRLLCTPLPWPERAGVVPRATRTRTSEETPRKSHANQGPVAFLKFMMNGQAVPEPYIVQPNMLYDLELQATFSRWPEGIERVRFSPLHVEPSGVVSAPVFGFDAPPTPTGESLSLTASGRFRIALPQDFLARPLEIAYAASAEGLDKEGMSSLGNILSVQGQRRLVVQSFDPRLNPITGVSALDIRLLEVRDEVRRHGLRDVEVANFLTLLGAGGKIAFKALADNVYKGDWSEATFQADVRSRLRDDPLIGSELEEHPGAAGGITDLSFHKVRLELKVDRATGISTASAADQFGQQLAQYVAGSDRRTGVLVVLDSARKETAPHSLENDISLSSVPPQSGERAILIGVVVVRGNLSRPSSLSR